VYLLYTLLYIGETDDKGVNIFHKRNYYVTYLLSTLYKSYSFTLQKRRFCTVKAALLHCKTYAFAMSNRNYRFSNELSLQNKGVATLFRQHKKKNACPR